jgi:hypothetical protein
LAKADEVGTWPMAFIATAGPVADTVRIPLTVLAVSHFTAGPNPFADSVTIFLGREPVEVENIAVFAVSGEKVWDNYSDTYIDGAGTIIWRGVNNSGTEVANGAYFILVKTSMGVQKIKVFKR